MKNEKNKENKKFSWTAFISFALTFSFFMVLFSGIVLTFVPVGRVAHWTNWTFLGLLKEDWEAQHTLFSYTFVIFSVFHLFSINWKVFLSYLRSKAQKGINKSKELTIATGLFFLILFGTYFQLPPFQNFMDFSNYLSGLWEQESQSPPIPHAERLSIEELAQNFEDTSPEKIIRMLEEQQIEVENKKQTLEEIGDKNGIAPSALYDQIVQAIEDHGSENRRGSGMGLGRKSLNDLTGHTGKSVDEMIQILKANGIEASPEQRLHDIADESGRTPREVYDMLSK